MRLEFTFACLLLCLAASIAMSERSEVPGQHDVATKASPDASAKTQAAPGATVFPQATKKNRASVKPRDNQLKSAKGAVGCRAHGPAGRNRVDVNNRVSKPTTVCCYELEINAGKRFPRHCSGHVDVLAPGANDSTRGVASKPFKTDSAGTVWRLRDYPNVYARAKGALCRIRVNDCE